MSNNTLDAFSNRFTPEVGKLEAKYKVVLKRLVTRFLVTLVPSQVPNKNRNTFPIDQGFVQFPKSVVSSQGLRAGVSFQAETQVSKFMVSNTTFCECFLGGASRHCPLLSAIVLLCPPLYALVGLCMELGRVWVLLLLSAFCISLSGASRP